MWDDSLLFLSSESPCFVSRVTRWKKGESENGTIAGRSGELLSDKISYLCSMKIKIINRSRHSLPEYATPLSAGMDLRANIDAPITLEPMARTLVPTGLYLALPAGYEAQVRPRSGMALKYGITCLNTPGTIDADYRGEVGVILANLSTEPFVINDGDRIAQMVIARHEVAEWEAVDTLDDTLRGSGGFGHTGKG